MPDLSFGVFLLNDEKAYSWIHPFANRNFVNSIAPRVWCSDNFAKHSLFAGKICMGSKTEYMGRHKVLINQGQNP